MTSAAIPGIDTTKRPRLNEIASSRGSLAARSADTRMPFESNWAGKLRVAELVQTNMLDAGAALVCEIITRRVALVQWIVSRMVALASVNRASLPPGTGK